MRLRQLLLAFALTALPTLVQAADPAPLAAHRALYKLTMDTNRGGDVSTASGTMAYEVTDACDAWATRQRLAMTLVNRDGQNIEMVTDYTTWESKDGLKMRFRMRQTTDTAVTEQVEGDAALTGPGGSGTIHYTIPEVKETALPPGTLFPMTHTAAIIAAAEAGKKFITLPIFDGTGDKGAQDSSIAIAGWNPPGAAPYPALAALPSGRVRVAFFDRDKNSSSADYEVGMRYWSNGVADDLVMDFTDFVMDGKLSEFTVPEPHC